MGDWFFDAPANLSDFSDPNIWHQEMVSESLGITIVLVADVLGKAPRQVTVQDLLNVAQHCRTSTRLISTSLKQDTIEPYLILQKRLRFRLGTDFHEGLTEERLGLNFPRMTSIQMVVFEP